MVFFDIFTMMIADFLNHYIIVWKGIKSIHETKPINTKNALNLFT